MRDDILLNLKYGQGTAARREMRCEMCADRIVRDQNYFFSEEKSGPLCFSCLLEHERRVEQYHADLAMWHELELKGHLDADMRLPRMPEAKLPF